MEVINIGKISPPLYKYLEKVNNLPWRKWKVNNYNITSECYNRIQKELCSWEHDGYKTISIMKTGEPYTHCMEIKKNILFENGLAFWVRTWTDACNSILEFENNQIKYIYVPEAFVNEEHRSNYQAYDELCFQQVFHMLDWNPEFMNQDVQEYKLEFLGKCSLYYSTKED